MSTGEHNQEKPRRILLVTGDSEARSGVDKGLKAAVDQHFELIGTNSLSGALDLAGRTSFSLVLLDLDLVDSSGAGTFTRFHAQIPAVPVVILAADRNAGPVQEALKEGAQDSLPKSDYDSELFFKTLCFVIDRQGLRDKLDITQHKLDDMIRVDPLTGMLNRRGLQQALDEEQERMQRGGHVGHIMLLDLDNFKSINDRMGFAVGDVVLKEVAEHLSLNLRTTDRVARVGGDEFVILLPHTREAAAVQLAQKIRLALSQGVKPSLGTRELRVTCSIGLVALSVDLRGIDTLLERLRLAMKRSKDSGKNRVYCGENDNEFHPGQSASIVEKLKKVETGDDFYALCQAITDIQNEKPCGYEMLSRLPFAEFGGPDDFFRAAMEANMLTTVDRWCLRKCLAAANLLEPGLPVHLNLFPMTMLELGAERLIEEFPANRNRPFCIEISEQQIVGDPAALQKVIFEFKKAGMLIAIDDIGFGHSCLESLILLEPDIVKIDRQCVREIEDAGNGKQRSLKRLLKVITSCEADAIAEGVETRDELDVLKEMGVTKVQGYLFGKPAKPMRKAA